MMNRVVIAILAILLIVIAACAPGGALRAKPLNTTALDPCGEVNCGENMMCVDGNCICGAGQKKCGDECISQSKCCDSSECGSDRACENGVCTQRPVCGISETWDENAKACACAPDAKFCEYQSKCIPGDSCCWHTECGRDERCTSTTYSASICLKETGKKCRIVHEGTDYDFNLLQGGRYNVQLQRVLENKAINVKVDNTTISGLLVNASKDINSNLGVFVEYIEIFGGYCRDEPD